MSKTGGKQVFTIPAGVPFARALAAQILKENKGAPEKLSQIQIFLPTRRAARVLREAFLKESGGESLLLPRLQSVGDVEEDALAMEMLGSGLVEVIDLKPGLPLLKRQLMLAQLVQKLDETRTPDQAAALAGALGQLIDHIYTENLNLADLKDLVPDDFASHWQITLDFLKVLSEHWPKILDAHGVIDMADRRNKLILALAAHWEKFPPLTPVIAAGSTGSIPATAKLLGVIAGLPQGRLVLPGLDQEMDDESWRAAQDHHPQFGLKNLLGHLEIERAQVQEWLHIDDDPVIAARRVFAAEIMRPAETTGVWQELSVRPSVMQSIAESLEGLSIAECANEQEEALLIAAMMREVLEEQGKTAVLITPDRVLARRVCAAAQRWGMVLDDSAGQGLDQTAVGQFFFLTLEACASGFAPVALLSLLKHEFMSRREFGRAIAELDLCLRGPKPPRGFEGIRLRVGDHCAEALRMIGLIEPVFKDLCFSGRRNFREILRAHLQVMEALAGEDMVWAEAAGEKAAQFFTEILDYADSVPELTLEGYGTFCRQLMRPVLVRSSYGTHPRLRILGQLEARLVDADLVIMAGLNEGTWPPEPGHDPWMSRPMRTRFGLPSPERSTGLAAHDFVQGFCAPKVVITRAARKDGAPTVISRWLQRLETVLEAVGLESSAVAHMNSLVWVRMMDQQNQIEPVLRPEPRPPVSVRPSRLSVTKIENWLKDPYSIYAQYILGLKKIDPLEQASDAALRGEILHKILERFVAQHKNWGKLPPQDVLYRELHELAKSVLEEMQCDPALWRFWWPRFSRVVEWLIAHEVRWRETFTSQATEVKGEIAIDGFTLSGKADRIDSGNGVAIIDYKSGGTYYPKAIRTGSAPQLPLEGLILENGGFAEVGSRDLRSLSYWILSGGGTPGKLVEVTDGLDEIVERSGEGLKALIDLFRQAETPYYSVPDPENALRFNDYEYLARIQEWGVLGDHDESGEAA